MTDVNTLDQRWVPVAPGVYPPGYFPEPIMQKSRPTFEHFNQLYTKLACISYSTPGYESSITINQQGTVSFKGECNYHVVTGKKQYGIKRIEQYNILPVGKYKVYDLRLDNGHEYYGEYYQFTNDITDESVRENTLTIPGIDIIDFIRRTPNLILSKQVPNNPSPDYFLSMVDGRICLNKGFYYIDDNGVLYEPPVIYNPYTFDPLSVKPTLKQVGRIMVDENERLSQIALGWSTKIRLINGCYTFRGLTFSIDHESNPCIFNNAPLNQYPFIDALNDSAYMGGQLSYMNLFHGVRTGKPQDTYPYYPLEYRSANETYYPYTYLPRQGNISWMTDGNSYVEDYQPNYQGYVDSITINFNRDKVCPCHHLWKPIPEFIRKVYKPFSLRANPISYPSIMVPGIYHQYYKRYINVKQDTPIISHVVGDILFNYVDADTGQYEWTYEIPFFHWQLNETGLENTRKINQQQIDVGATDNLDELHYNARISIPTDVQYGKDVSITPKDIIYPETYYPAMLRGDIEYDLAYPIHPTNHRYQLDIYHEKYEGKYNPIVLSTDTSIESHRLVPRDGKEIALAYLYCKIYDVWMWVGLETGVKLDIVNVDGVLCYSYNPIDENGNIKDTIVPLGDMVSDSFLTRLAKYSFPLRVMNSLGQSTYHPMGCILSPLTIDVNGNIDIKIHLLDLVNLSSEVMYIGEGSTLKYNVEKGGYVLNGTLTFIQQSHYFSLYGNETVIKSFPIDVNKLDQYKGLTVLDTIGINDIQLSKPIYDWFDII